jgi:hypothetical protein
VTQSFLDFISHFWVFVSRYSDSAIFDLMTQSFFRFRQFFLDFLACSVIFWTCQPFLRVLPVRYSDSAIFALVTQSFFCYNDSVIFGFRQPVFRFLLRAIASRQFLLRWLSYFSSAIFLGRAGCGSARGGAGARGSGTGRAGETTGAGAGAGRRGSGSGVAQGWTRRWLSWSVGLLCLGDGSLVHHPRW